MAHYQLEWDKQAWSELSSMMSSMLASEQNLATAVIALALAVAEDPEDAGAVAHADSGFYSARSADGCFIVFTVIGTSDRLQVLEFGSTR